MLSNLKPLSSEKPNMTRFFIASGIATVIILFVGWASAAEPGDTRQGETTVERYVCHRHELTQGSGSVLICEWQKEQAK